MTRVFVYSLWRALAPTSHLTHFTNPSPYMTPDASTQTLQVKDFALDSARFILERARESITARGLFRLALAGGETPAAVYAKLAEIIGDLPLQKVQITFGDERCVTPDHEHSNYRMANESLLSRVPLPAGNVFRMRGEIDPVEAALEYESKLAAVAARLGEARYVHDLILLGMGADGHTASLFPGSPALNEITRNIIPATGPKPPPQRLTMTFPLLNAAREVCFLIADPSQKPVLQEVLAGNPIYPASLVRPSAGRLTWIMGTPA